MDMPLIPPGINATPEDKANGERMRRRRELPSFRRTFFFVNMGLLLTAIGIVIFKAPNHFALGGTSGLSIILSTLLPQFDVGDFMWMLNVILVVAGLILLDFRTMGWTVFASFALSFYVSLIEIIWPRVTPLTSNPLLELCFAVMLPAMGSALVFNVGASTGGTDILALILKRRTHLRVGQALLATDGAIVAVAVFLYGAETGLLCILGLLAKTLIVDNAIEGFNQSKVCTVLCPDPAAAIDFLVNQLYRTATLTQVQGAFSGKPMTQITVVLSRPEAVRFRAFLAEQEPQSFMTMVSSSEIIGRGFRSI